jgi:flagellar protein FliS
MRAARTYQSIDRHTAVMAGNPIDLVILLYERLLQHLMTASKSMEKNDIAARGLAIGKAIEIIEKGLIGCLDMQQGGDLAVRLKFQYEFWMHQLLRVNMNADPELLKSVDLQVKDILSSWRELKTIGPQLAVRSG